MTLTHTTFYHGKSNRETPHRENRQHGLFLAEDRRIAEAYAGSDGKVIATRIKEEAKVLDASGTVENDNWHRPDIAEWARFLAMLRKHGIDPEGSFNYDISHEPIAWEAILDSFDGLGQDSRLSDVLRELDYEVVLTSDLDVGIIGDILKRFGEGAAHRVRRAIGRQKDVPIAIVLKRDAIVEVQTL